MTVSQIADSLAAATDTVVHPVSQLLPDAPPTPLEAVMLQQDKLYVVAAVVVIIWLGVVLLLLATDRRLARLERALDLRDGAAGDAGDAGDSAL